MAGHTPQPRPGSTALPLENSKPFGASELSLEAIWTGACPGCGEVFELGYAGSLPPYPATGPTTPLHAVLSAGRSRSTIGGRIRARREELGVSQAKLAASGISRTYISLVERGRRNPSAKALRALAPVLDTSTHWLETGKTDPAEELAELVLTHPGNVLTPRSRRLARRVLDEDRT